MAMSKKSQGQGLQSKADEIENKIAQFIKSTCAKIFRSSHGLPIVLTLAILSVLFVVFRMKSIEQSYALNDINAKINKEIFISKELKARKAHLLSVKNLRKLAQAHNLDRPREDQIIVIP